MIKLCHSYLIIFFLSFVPNSILAKITCVDPNLATFARAFVSQEAARSWVPSSISFDEYQVDYFRQHENKKGLKYEILFFWEQKKWSGKYNPVKKQLKFYMNEGGFRIPGPIYWNGCTENSGSKKNSAVESPARVIFNSLSSCNRKYIQNFLKTAGLYSSSIDGRWGPGTARAIQNASRLSKLRGLSSEAIIRKLSDNLICD